MKKIFLYEPDAAIFEIVTFALADLGHEVKPLPVDVANFENRLVQSDLIWSSLTASGIY